MNIYEEMTNEFQCSGCVCGSDTGCGSYNADNPSTNTCSSHVLGTSTLGFGNFALGMPKGFNKAGLYFSSDNKWVPRNTMDIRFFKKEDLEYDFLNVPVWAMVEDGYLFVRTFAPRINKTWVDVVIDGELSLVPKAIDVSEFADTID